MIDVFHLPESDILRSRAGQLPFPTIKTLGSGADYYAQPQDLDKELWFTGNANADLRLPLNGNCIPGVTQFRVVAAIGTVYLLSVRVIGTAFTSFFTTTSPVWTRTDEGLTIAAGSVIDFQYVSWGEWYLYGRGCETI